MSQNIKCGLSFAVRMVDVAEEEDGVVGLVDQLDEEGMVDGHLVDLLGTRGG